MSRKNTHSTWFSHPKFLSAKNVLIKRFKSHQGKYPSDYKRSLFGGAKLPRILFICGGDPKDCNNREVIECYLDKHAPNLMTFRAENAWEIISSNQSQNKDGSINALRLEEWLADFSDAVIILVESYGTVAELGAFSISSRLRSKLLPILDKNFEDDLSFINTGPISWINSDSVYKPTIYADFDTILTTMPLMIDNLSRGFKSLKKDHDDKFGDKNFSRKELLFIVVIIITSIGPIDENNIYDICKQSFKLKDNESEVKFIISLCVALKIIESFSFKDKKLYTCINYERLYRNETTTNLLSVSRRLRLTCLSKLLYIEEFKEAIRKVTD
ncbi:retron St85 family effector protein [Vibrio parahaemolyticus]|uniref:retron St85 family effector protein n=1 Tax=Vibrio parahaemolyticus TaxID=670 RepID=UPI00040AC117|nr:retron St85 family effector protein [Vibrio parahaemolyticus]MDG2744674.1 retron St85 family effector protein [Vibrio parahaemolyticus]HCH6234129.1 retron St85 family effector protein [Vibrio parahaemolyticus]HCM1462847.1 retron St85 family effector protein [Vibrio parahaemolyticus]HCM1465922.1 retron St85 family effector protein [Vibrio parahaemolyticus]